MNERRQFIDTAYGASLECAACLDVLRILASISASIVCDGKDRLSAIVAMLLGFRQSTGNQVREEPLPYESGPDSGNRIFFDHERLDVYRKALDLVRWCDRLEKSGCVVRSEATVLDKTSTGVVLNIAEGNGKFSGKDRGRFIGHARTSALQAAATLDIFATRHVDQAKNILDGKTLLVDCVRMLVAWQQSIEES